MLNPFLWACRVLPSIRDLGTVCDFGVVRRVARGGLSVMELLAVAGNEGISNSQGA